MAARGGGPTWGRDIADILMTFHGRAQQRQEAEQEREWRSGEAERSRGQQEKLLAFQTTLALVDQLSKSGGDLEKIPEMFKLLNLQYKELASPEVIELLGDNPITPESFKPAPGVQYRVSEEEKALSAEDTATRLVSGAGAQGQQPPSVATQLLMAKEAGISPDVALGYAPSRKDEFGMVSNLALQRGQLGGAPREFGLALDQFMPGISLMLPEAPTTMQLAREDLIEAEAGRARAGEEYYLAQAKAEPTRVAAAKEKEARLWYQTLIQGMRAQVGAQAEVARLFGKGKEAELGAAIIKMSQGLSEAYGIPDFLPVEVYEQDPRGVFAWIKRQLPWIEDEKEIIIDIMLGEPVSMKQHYADTDMDGGGEDIPIEQEGLGGFGG